MRMLMLRWNRWEFLDGIPPSEDGVREAVGFAVVQQVFGEHLPQAGPGGAVHLHSLENGDVVPDLKGKRKVE